MSFAVGLFSFRGRINGQQYLVAQGTVAAIWVLLSALVFCSVRYGYVSWNDSKAAVIAVFSFVTLAFIVGLAAQAVKRCHDLGKSGWWTFVGMIPHVSQLFDLGMLFMAGQPEANKYGPPPGNGWTFSA